MRCIRRNPRITAESCVVVRASVGSLFIVNAHPSFAITRIERGSTMRFLNLNIRGRLILGFSVLCALLAVVVGVTIVKVSTVNESTERTVNLRVPTAMTASDVVAGVYASLASLRGFLVTGNDTFKTERACHDKRQRYAPLPGPVEDAAVACFESKIGRAHV